MTEERRSGGRRGKAARGSSLIPQLPWRAVENPYPPLDALDRATVLWQRALKEYEEPLLDPAIREELDAYVAKRREDIKDGEP